jgi:cobalt-zinc-cadmium efflux system protein
MGDHSHEAMAMDSHSHGPHWIFKLGILLNLSFLIADLIVWQISGSAAIFGDAMHNGLHGMVHISALWGHSLEKNFHGRKESYASKQRKNQATQLIGYLIIAGALLICAFGALQIQNPGEVAGKYMLIMALLDIMGDIFLAILLIRHKGDTTARAVFVDTSIDILASMGVIAGGVVILFTGYYRADGIAAIPIALIALYLARQTIQDAKKAR